MDTRNYPQQDDLLSTINHIIVPLSLVATSVMIYMCATTKPLTLSVKLIIGLATSDLLYTVANLLAFFNNPSGSPMCTLEGSLKYFFFTISTSWASAIALLHFKLANPNIAFDREDFFKRTLVIGFVTTLILTLGPLYNSNLSYDQRDEPFCYLTIKESETVGGFLSVVFYIGLPTILVLIFTVLCYIFAVKRFRATTKALMLQVRVNTSFLIFYPLVLFITLLPYLIYSFLDYLRGQPDDKYHALQAIEIVTTHSLGLTNALVYGIQRRMVQKRKSPRVVELPHPSVMEGTSDAYSPGTGEPDNQTPLCN